MTFPNGKFAYAEKRGKVQIGKNMVLENIGTWHPHRFKGIMVPESRSFLYYVLHFLSQVSN